MTRRCLVLLALAGLLAGCSLRPGPDRPPLQVHPDMDNQPKYKPQSQSAFFGDGRAARKPVDGTIPRGQLRESDALFTGKAGGDFLKTVPMPITEALLKRGQERFNISCAPCHGLAGAGNGIVAARSNAALVPANLHDERLRQVPDGYLFDVITNGVRSLYLLRHQITEPDRWAIVTYVRALQRSQNAAAGDVPAGQQVN
jgi:mono/diheme cytochrome c family protein